MCVIEQFNNIFTRHDLHRREHWCGDVQAERIFQELKPADDAARVCEYRDIVLKIYPHKQFITAVALG